MADEDRPFVITVRRQWTLWILPALATIYFLAVILLNVLDYRIRGVDNDLLVLTGVGLFALVILIELPFLLRRRPKKEPRIKASPAPVAAPAAESLNGWDDELSITGESQQGLQVIEYSAPAKSRNANAVYTKTYVPVTGAHVLRIETLAADESEI
ncbi:MAG TPA: hypothetical protein VM582_08185 [Candidatus Thermoplasmatota archaeon]|nr:hypothetical protein [Candidatus Thermoplasmatota archaeon]